MLADPLLALAADVLDDLERVRIANENRLRQLTRVESDKDGGERGFGLDESHPDVARLAALVESLAKAEHDAELQLKRQLRRHPLGPWVARTKGVGEKQAARLLAAIGDPYWNDLHGRSRLVSELWSYCVPTGELVSTPAGSVPIENLAVGDEVYGQDGKARPVERVMSRQVEESLVVLDALKTLPLRLTAEHPVLVATFERLQRPYRWQRTSLLWKRADEVATGEYLVVPRLAEGPTSTDEPTTIEARFWGRFVGDGSTCIYAEGKYRRGRATLTFGHHEDSAPWAAIARELYGGAYVCRTGTAQQLQFGRLRVAESFRAKFGRGATSKRVCEDVMKAGKDVARAFLLGYLSADGCVTGNGTNVAGTVSRGLALQLQLLSTRIGSLPSVYHARSAGTGVIRGRTVQLADRWGVQWSPGDSGTLRGDAGGTPKLKYRQDDQYFYVPVQEVRRERYKGTVYDLSCGGSFLLNNVVVHNCGYHVISAGHTARDTQGCGASGNGGDPGHGVADAQSSSAGVAAVPRRGQRANWSATAKMRTYLIAESCVKSLGSPYRPVYDEGRVKYRDAVHQVDCKRCGPAGKPAQPGSPLSLGHQHARALRLVAKAVLKDLWREARDLHLGAEEDAA